MGSHGADRDWQAFYAGHHCGCFLVAVVVLGEVEVAFLLGWGRGGGISFCLDRLQGFHSGAGNFGLADVEQAEKRADRVGAAFFCAEFGDRAMAQGGHAHYRLVGFDLDDVLIGVDGVASGHKQPDDRGLGDRLAKLRHEDGDGGHCGKSWV